MPINPMLPAAGLSIPPDTQMQQQELARRQALVNAFTQQALAPQQGQMVGNRYVGGGLPDAISRIALAYMANKNQQGINQQQADLANQYQQGMQQAFQQYNDMRQSDPTQAAINAIASGYAPLAQAGTEDLKRQPTIKDVAQYASGDSLRAMVNKYSGMNDFQAKNDLKEFTPGHVILDSNNRVFTPPGGPGYKLIKDDQGNLLQQTATGVDEVSKAPHISVSPQVNVNTAGETEFAKKVGELNAKDLGDAMDRKQKAQQLLNLADKVEQLNKAGMFHGPFTQQIVALDQIARQLGLNTDKEKGLNTQEYMNQVKKQIADVITASGGVGRSFSNEDAKLTMDALGGTGLDAEALARVTQNWRKAAGRDINYANSFIQNAKKAVPQSANLVDMHPDYPVDYVPPAAAQQPGQPAAPGQPVVQPGDAIPLQDYLNMYRKK